MTIEDIMREFPQLKPAQVHDAFSCYYDNRKEIEKDIAENEMDAPLPGLMMHIQLYLDENVPEAIAARTSPARL